MVFRYGREIRTPSSAGSLEFLITGNNAYCSSTVSGNARRYHGLFVLDGRLLLAGLDERVNGIQISAQQYEGALNGDGLRFLIAFSAYPPTWVYGIDGVVLKKTITFEGRRFRVIYEINGEADIWIRPLITDRPVRELARNPSPQCSQNPAGFAWNNLRFEGDLSYEAKPEMYWNVWYHRERERGYDSAEDLFSPGVYSGLLRDTSVSFNCTSSKDTVLSPHHPVEQQNVIDHLEWASEAFCKGDEIFAGYHWFCESWGRDSAVSVTGLLVERELKEQAKSVLARLAGWKRNGIIPNRFPDNYHASDTSLWFIEALFRYRQKWGDDLFIEQMMPVIENILAEYPSSGVALLDDDLITVAPQSTWMDTIFTPRKGKPVEINALWVHILREAGEMGISTPVQPKSALDAFQAFWNEERGCFYDTIEPNDPSVRPNQIIPLALGFIDQERAESALKIVARELLTPYGLRSLSPLDEKYIGHFDGDRSYHNGCVWPWLTGHYCEALIKNGVSKERVANVLTPVLFHLREAGIGYISEIFDGDPPYSPNGCIAQAWSVAEVARAYRLCHGTS